MSYRPESSVCISAQCICLPNELWIPLLSSVVPSAWNISRIRYKRWYSDYLKKNCITVRVSAGSEAEISWGQSIAEQSCLPYSSLEAEQRGSLPAAPVPSNSTSLGTHVLWLGPIPNSTVSCEPQRMDPVWTWHSNDLSPLQEFLHPVSCLYFPQGFMQDTHMSEIRYLISRNLKYL